MNQAQIELVSVKAPADSSELIGAVASIGLIPAAILWTRNTRSIERLWPAGHWSGRS